MEMVKTGLLLLLVSSVVQCGEGLVCQVHPVEYSFRTDKVQRENETSCGPHPCYASYTLCTGPSRLTDSELGPQQYDSEIDNAWYYIWEGGAGGGDRFYLLFTLNQTVNISNITLHYFVYNQGDIQPLVSLYGVAENFELQNLNTTNLSDSVAGHILLLSPSRGLQTASTQLTISSSKILMQVNVGGIGAGKTFSLSEVEFSRNASGVCPALPTTPATADTTTTCPPASTAPTTETQEATGKTSATTDSSEPPPRTSPVTTAITTTDPLDPPLTSSLDTDTSPTINTLRTSSKPIAAGVAVVLVILVAITTTTIIAVICRCKKSGKMEIGLPEPEGELCNRHYMTVTRKSPSTGQASTPADTLNDPLYSYIQDPGATGVTGTYSEITTTETANDATLVASTYAVVNKTANTAEQDEHYKAPQPVVYTNVKKKKAEESTVHTAEYDHLPANKAEQDEQYKEYATIDEAMPKPEKAELKVANDTNKCKKAPPIVALYKGKKVVNGQTKEKEGETADIDNPEEQYAVVDKTKKRSKQSKNATTQLVLPPDGFEEHEQERDSQAPELPPHSVEMLYTAVVKKDKKNTSPE